ncbi:MAG: hypothetical protein RR993_05140 [Clostridia bacterium]
MKENKDINDNTKSPSLSKKKTIKLVGLIVLTLLFVAVVIGVMFAANSCEQNKVIQSGVIQQMMTTDELSFVVQNVEFEKELNGQKAGDDEAFAIVTINITAAKNMSLKPSHFVLSNGSKVNRNFGEGYLSGSQKIVAEEENVVKMVFNVKYNSSMTLYLLCYDCKIALGSSIMK